MKRKLTSQEIIDEILRVKKALGKTDSITLKDDYNKYLKKLFKELRKIKKESNNI